MRVFSAFLKRASTAFWHVPSKLASPLFAAERRWQHAGMRHLMLVLVFCFLIQSLFRTLLTINLNRGTDMTDICLRGDHLGLGCQGLTAGFRAPAGARLTHESCCAAGGDSSSDVVWL